MFGGNKGSQEVTMEGKVVPLLGSVASGARGSHGQTGEGLGETKAVKGCGRQGEPRAVKG